MPPTENHPIDAIGWLLIASLFSLLAYAGWLSYKSIDWDILKKLESIPLVLPTPIIAPPATSSATPIPVATSSATLSATPKI